MFWRSELVQDFVHPPYWCGPVTGSEPSVGSPCLAQISPKPLKHYLGSKVCRRIAFLISSVFRMVLGHYVIYLRGPGKANTLYRKKYQASQGQTGFWQAPECLADRSLFFVEGDVITFLSGVRMDIIISSLIYYDDHEVPRTCIPSRYLSLLSIKQPTLRN